MDSLKCQKRECDNRPIGVFDSGVGGLTVLKEIVGLLPYENIIYFGDTLRAPYGDKDDEIILRYSLEVADFLYKKNVKAIVIACNTATARALDAIVERFDIPVIGVVDSGVKGALNITRNNKIGIAATKSTINSGIYSSEIKKNNIDIEVYEKACPLLCPLVEEGYVNDEFLGIIIKNYLNQLICEDIDTLVLACTHYPLLKKHFEYILGEKVKIVDPALGTANKLKEILLENNTLNLSGEKSEYNFYVSGDINKFKKILNLVFNTANIEVGKVERTIL